MFPCVTYRQARTLSRNFVHSEASDTKPTQNKKYWEKHKEKLMLKGRQWYLQNKDKKALYAAEYRKKNSDKLRSYDKQYYEANRDRWKNKVFDKSAQKAQFLTRKERHAEWLSTSPEIKSQIEEALNISDPSDWYNVTQKQLRCTPHGMLISKYFTRQEFLQDYPWIAGYFKKAPLRTWDSPERTREYLVSLEAALFIEKTEDWARISRKQLIAIGASGCANHFGTMYKMLSFAFPDVAWQEKDISHRSKKSQQKLLCSVLTKEFTGACFMEDFKYPVDYKDGLRILELDVWIPEKRLAFEYQGEQHYHDMEIAFGTSGVLMGSRSRDATKERICAAEGIHLVKVPYWWDSSKESLLEIFLEHE